jgi:hypothetical protein
VSYENPRDVWDLSRARYEQALARIEAALQIGWSRGDPDLINEMRIIWMVGMHPTPWWGDAVDPADSSVTVGVMMRNAFESVGDYLDGPFGEGPQTKADNWLTRRYLPLWRQGERKYLEWLDTLALDRPPDDAGQ